MALALYTLSQVVLYQYDTDFFWQQSTTREIRNDMFTTHADFLFFMPLVCFSAVVSGGVNAQLERDKAVQCATFSLS